MKVLLQLLKEFWFPFSCALAWTLFNKPLGLKEVVPLFGASFFFVAWITGQVFRVKKQTAVESSLVKIKSDIAALLHNLQVKTDELIGHVTGGESFCWISEVYLSDDFRSAVALLNHDGSPYPVFDLKARVADLDALQEGRLAQIDSFILPVSVLPPGAHLLTNVRLPLGEGDRRSFNIFFDARNGSFTQMLRFAKVDGHWVTATRVIKRSDDTHCFECIHHNFPNREMIDW